MKEMDNQNNQTISICLPIYNEAESIVMVIQEWLDLMKEWGIVCEDPKAEFNKMDISHDDAAEFNEFSVWAIRKAQEHESEQEKKSINFCKEFKKSSGLAGAAGNSSC